MVTQRSAPPDPPETRELIARIDAACASGSKAEGLSVLRHIPGKRAILHGRFGGRPAVFRLFLAPGVKEAQREWDELQRIWPKMQEGDLRVVEPFHFDAPTGVMVIEKVEGTPLLEHLFNLPPEARAGLMDRPAQWLRRYTRISEKQTPAKAEKWLNRAETLSAAQPHAKLKRREQKLIQHLHRILPAAQSEPWRSAISHGDFHPNNLILKAPRLTGIDLGGSARLPIYKDMARFLMHMGRRGMVPSGHARFGVDAEGVDAFATAFGLTAWERDIVLPFMLGIEALIRVENPKIGRARIRQAAQMYDLLLADLAQI